MRILPSSASAWDSSFSLSESEESPGVKGLGILKGKILRIPENGDLKIPHMGWNSLKLSGDGRLFKDLPEDPYVYFVHSYYLKAEENIVKARTWYGVPILTPLWRRATSSPASSIRRRVAGRAFRY